MLVQVHRCILATNISLEDVASTTVLTIVALHNLQVSGMYLRLGH